MSVFLLLWPSSVAGSDERNGIGERGGKDGVDVEIGGKGTLGMDGEEEEFRLHMEDEANAYVPV